MKKNWNKKVVKGVIGVLLLILVSVMTSLFIHRTTPASKTIKNGLSAYELAVQYGYDGTVEEWLASLNGKSAYEIAVENGYSGTEKEWSNTLAAMSKANSASIKTASFSKDGELIITLSDDTVLNLGVAIGKDGKDGADGKNGVNGKDGADGKDGTDGIGISSVFINDKGQLVIQYSDGQIVNLDKVVDMNGTDGVSVTKSEINSNGELVLTYSNGQKTNVGVVVGANGKDGTKGTDGVGIANVTISDEGALTVTLTSGTILNLGNIKGQDGVGITKSEINADGELLLTYSNGETVTLGNVVGSNGRDGVGIKEITLSSDGDLSILMTNHTVKNLGNIKGEKGEQGPQGIQGEIGPKGENGKEGRGIDKMEIVGGELVVTYTDGTSANVGTINADEEISEDLIYVLLDDGTYGVKAASTFTRETLVIPETYNGISVTQVLENGFKNRTTIKTIEFPSSLVSIGRYAFYNCNLIESITIPAKVEFIGACAFYKCSALTSATLEVTDGWVAGSDGFAYPVVYQTYNTSTGAQTTSISYGGCSLTNSSSVAKALIGSVSVVCDRQYRNSQYTYQYRDMYWYAEDWIR